MISGGPFARHRPLLIAAASLVALPFLMQALGQGWNLGDAACYATPALSWQTIVIGDPLYRPFAVPLDAQLAHVGALPQALAPYVLLRKARLLESEKKNSEAVAVYRAILDNPALGQVRRAIVLRNAAEIARAAGEPSQAAAWQAELAESPSPPPAGRKM